MQALTVTSLYVQGEYPYTPEYVVRLRDMVNRWIDRPHRFVCLTDQPWLFTDIETIPIQKLPHCFAYWTKLELFNPKREWSGRVLYLDLDVLIVAPLAPIIDYPAHFALTADPPFVGQKTEDRFGRKIVRKFNSSVMVWTGCEETHLYERWSRKAADRYSGDQDFIAVHSPYAAGLPRQWFPRLSEVGQPPFSPDVKVILSKYIAPRPGTVASKNERAIEVLPWFAPLWGAA